MTNAMQSPVTRETCATYRHRALVVTITGYVLEIREKGRKTRIEVPIDAVYDLGMKLKARRDRAEKKGKGNGR